MIKLLTFGLLLGLGAAIPIGPVNLEIIRRNLQLGILTGFTLGIGACIADVTYLVLLSYGSLQFLNTPHLLKIITIIGSLILAWFGWMALSQKSEKAHSIAPLEKRSYTRHLRDGYLLTLINPYNIIFWSSVSVTIAANTLEDHAVTYAGLGVLLGVFGWIVALNVFLYFTRHHISNKIMNKINFAGGLILMGFAVIGLGRAFIS